MTVIEVHALNSICSYLPRIAKALEQIAATLENKPERKEVDNAEHE